MAPASRRRMEASAQALGAPRTGRMMRPAHAGPLAGMISLLLLLAVLAATVGLSWLGWAAGLTCGAALSAALAYGLSRYGLGRLGLADWVTLARATLAVGVVALVADSFNRPAPVAALVSVAA